MGKLFHSILETIGHTPIVELHQLARHWDGRVLAKLEHVNPGASKKDRIALAMIEDARRSGELCAGQTVVELTSGNTGTGLAIVCRAKGHPFVAVMSKGNSRERARMMGALGAEVVLVDQDSGSRPGQVSGADLERVEERTQQLVKLRNAFRADQFRREAAAKVHAETTAGEIIEQTGGEFQGFCDFVGTGGTFGGCSRAFKQYREEIRCFVVEPAGAAILSGQSVENPNHRIQGGGYCRRELPLIDRRWIDGFLGVTDQEAILWTRRLAAEEGIFAGFSTGANLAGAAKLLSGELEGQTVIILVCDSGLKYMSTELWE